jgi:Uma2 family endonuclease
MSPIGSDHASDHSIINTAINLYAASKGIALNGKDNCSYRMTGYREAQPDLSYYIGDAVNEILYGTGIVKLEKFVPPTLVVKISNTSLTDDQGRKRLLYEDLGVAEYWIVDVQEGKVIGFRMEDQGSYRIQTSRVLEGLELLILEEALKMTRQTSHTQVTKWLLKKFS